MTGYPNVLLMTDQSHLWSRLYSVDDLAELKKDAIAQSIRYDVQLDVYGMFNDREVSLIFTIDYIQRLHIVEVQIVMKQFGPIVHALKDERTIICY